MYNEVFFFFLNSKLLTVTFAKWWGKGCFNFFFLFAYLFPSKYNEYILGQTQEKTKRGFFFTFRELLTLNQILPCGKAIYGQPFRGHCWGWDYLVMRYAQDTKLKGVLKKLSNKKNI